MKYTRQELDEALQAVLDGQGNTQDTGAGFYRSGNLFVNQYIFIVDTLQDAQGVEAAGGAAIALGTAQGPYDLINLLTDWNGPEWQDGAGVVIVNNSSAADTWKPADILYTMRELRIKCIEWNLCGKYKTPKEAAAANLEQFTQEVKRALMAAETARIPDNLDAFLEKIQTRRYEPHTTGLLFFDDLLSGGIIDGTMLVLIAPPATGKTTLCLQLATALAAHKTPVVYLNFEMNNDQMLAKAISCQLAAAGKKYSTTRILQGYNWSDADKRTITAAVDKYRETTAPFLTFKPPAVSEDLDAVLDYLQELGEKAEKAKGHAPAIIIDYLQMITTAQRIDIKTLIQKVVYGIKSYVNKYNTFAILISAQGREDTKKGEVTMTSGRDSSNIEYSADYGLLLNYEAYETGEADPENKADRRRVECGKVRKMVLKLGKNRFADKGGRVVLEFNAELNYFKAAKGFERIDDGDQQIVIGPPPKRKRA